MADFLPLTTLAIEDCREHFTQHPDIDQAIVDYLVRHVNGLLCAEVEQVVTDLFRSRLEKGTNDVATARYIRRTLGRSVVRNVKYREIKDKIAFFGDDFGIKFEEFVENSVGEEGVETLGMAVGKRDQDAHHQPPSITFSELEEAHRVASLVVEDVQKTLET